VLIAFFIYNYSGVNSIFYSTSYFPPFLACFFSSFFAGGAFPPFLFLSSMTYYSLLNNLIAYVKSLSSFGYPLSLIFYNELKVSIFISNEKG
jgi:hypothetical protein